MKLKNCEITTKVEFIDSLTTDLYSFLSSVNMIKDFAFIIHDKDVNSSGEIKDAHYHIVLRLKDSYDTKHIAKWFNISDNFVERCKGRFSDVLKYLTHSNALDKYQYSDDEVVSNYDWKKEVEKSSNKSDVRKIEIMNDIVNGVIKEYNIVNALSIEEYDKYKRNIDNAFKYRQEKLMLEENRKMDVIFITGESGSGKTTYAKQIANNKGYSVFVSSSSNDVLDGYKGQECIILDDLRGSCMSLSDLLKMLDNHTNTSVKSRYRNKVLECKLIVITTVLNIDDFYSNVFESEDEPILQFRRRCKMKIRMTKSKMFVSAFNAITGTYSNEACVPNPVQAMFMKDKRELLDFMQEYLTDVSEYIENNKDVISNELEYVEESCNPF